MKKVLISYFSRTGKTQQMAEYIAEGIRISGHEAELRKISDIKSEKELSGYDGYIFGAPTYHRAMPGLGCTLYHQIALVIEILMFHIKPSQ